MKYKIFLVIFVFAINSVITANPIQARIIPGFRAGLTTSTLSEGETEYGTGYSLGLILDIESSVSTNNFLVSVEFNITNRSGNIKKVTVEHFSYDNVIFHYNYDVSKSYFEIPILAKFKFPIANYATLRPYLGLSLSPFGNDKTETKDRSVFIEDYTGNPHDLNPDVTVQGESDYFSRGITGLVVGCSYHKNKAFVDLRYFRANSSIKYFELSDKVEREVYKWRTFQVSFGFMLK